MNCDPLAYRHDGEAPSPQCRTTAGHRRHYCDRLRDSLRSGDISLLQILKWLNAIANRKSKNRKFPIPAIYISTLVDYRMELGYNSCVLRI